MAAAAVALAICAPYGARCEDMKTVQAVPANAFLETLGVNLHMGNTWSENSYSDVSKVEAALQYLGFRYARDRVATLPYGVSPISRLEQLHSDLGIKYQFFVGFNYPLEISEILSHMDMVAEVEGSNEIDNWPPALSGLIGYQAAEMIQQRLWQDIKQAPGGASVPVDSLTVANFANNHRIGNLAPYADRSAMHIYQVWGGPAGSYTYPSIQWNMQTTSPVKDKPMVISETGWFTYPAKDGVTEIAQAKFQLDAVLDAFLLGIKRTMLYELLDQGNDPMGRNIEQHFGLFHSDGTAKYAGFALHNLTAMLKDGPSDMQPGSLEYSIAGLPETVHQLLLQKSDGTFVLIVWNEDKFWDNVTHRELTVMPITTTLQLARPAQSVQLFDPLVGTGALLYNQNASSMLFSIPDHPVMVFISPN